MSFFDRNEQRRVGDHQLWREVPQCTIRRQKQGCTALLRMNKIRSTISRTPRDVCAYVHVLARRTYCKAHGAHVRHCTSHAQRLCSTPSGPRRPTSVAHAVLLVYWCVPTFVEVSVVDGLYRLIVSLSTSACCVLQAVFFLGTTTVCTMYLQTPFNGLT